jgi:hypothetical protein
VLLKLKRVMEIVIGSSVGVYLGRIIWIWIDYRSNPDLYALYSAPWYTQIIISSVISGSIVLIELIGYLFIRYKIKKIKNFSKGDFEYETSEFRNTEKSLWRK